MNLESIPSFASEEEEAAWWDDNPEALADRFRMAKEQGSVCRLSETDLPGASETAAIRIPHHDLARARQLAGKRGLGYQTYLQMLLHEALDNEEKASEPSRSLTPDASIFTLVNGDSLSTWQSLS